MTILSTYGPLVGGVAGGGDGGILLRVPNDVFNGATKVAAETARDAAITDTTPFDENPALAIILTWPVVVTDTVYQARRSNAWADVTGVVRGPRGAASTAAGPAGATGPAGAMGAAGAAGAAGASGAAGAMGAAGAAGPGGTPGTVGPIGPIGPGTAGTPTSLSRFEAHTTVNLVAQALSAVYADVLEIAPTDVFANVGGFTMATFAGITTITVPNSGLFKLSAHVKIVTAQTNRARVNMRANVLRNGVVVPDSDTIMSGPYVRAQPNTQSGVASGTTTLLLGLGDTINFQMQEEGNTDNTYTFGGSDSVIEIVEIPSEIVGVEGPAGAGPAQDEGTEVVAAPTAYNFVGDGVVVTDVGGVATITITGGGTPDPGDHTRRAAISEDETLDTAENTAATTTTSDTVTMPTWTGGTRFLYIGVPEAEGDITGISTGNIDVFTAWERVAGVLFAHKWWKTIDAQTDVASGAMYVITEA